MAKRSTTPRRVSKDSQVELLAKHVRLRELKMVGCRCGQSMKTLEGTPPPNTLAQRVNIQSGKNEVAPHGQIILFITFTLIASDEPPVDGAEAPVLVETTFIVVYELLESINTTDRDLQAFGQLNGMLNTWPYWREFVHSMTGRLGLPPLKVPLLVPGNLQFQESDEPPKAKIGVQNRQKRK